MNFFLMCHSLQSVYDNAGVLPRTTLAQMVERNKL